MSKKVELLKKAAIYLADLNAYDLISEIEAELAKPEAEPVKLRFPSMYGGDVQGWLNDLPPLYTHPPRQQEPLSEAELLGTISPHCGSYEMMGIRIARAIERAHGIGVTK